MAVLATVACPHCDRAFQIEYVRLGAVAPCPSCGRLGIAEVPKGVGYPRRDYEMTFKSFMRLISFGAYREEVGPFLRACGLVLLGTEEDTRLEREDGTPVDPLEAHLEIQSDPRRQRDIYQVAMSVWQ